MKNLFVIIALLFSVSAFAQKKAAAPVKHYQGVCEEPDYKDPKRFKCWWGTNNNDSITVDNDRIWIGVRDVQGFAVGEYTPQHTHVFYGLGGDDEIIGGDRSDIISGGNDQDMLRGGKGNDFIYGDKGFDTLYGEEGDDHLIGGPDNSNDVVYGGVGNDYLDGGKGQNGSFGGPGNDTIVANGDDSTILPDDEKERGYSDVITIYGVPAVKGNRDIKNATCKRYEFDPKDVITYPSELRP